MLTARTRFRLRNAKSLKRRASAKTRRHGKSACLHAKNAHKVPCFHNYGITGYGLSRPGIRN